MLIASSQAHDQTERWRAFICNHMSQSAALTQRTAETSADSILGAAGVMVDCFRSGKKVLICGNGGSAADAQHMAAEFLNRLSRDCDRPGLPAIALTTDTSFLTAYANDYGYDGVFERQVHTLANAGDVLIGISTSGNSQNVIRAVTAGRERKLMTIGLLGEGGSLGALVDQAVVVESRDTQHVQECFLAIEHALCLVVEQALFASK